MSRLSKLAEQSPYAFVIGVFVFQAAVAVPFVAAFKLLGLDIVPLRLIIPVAQSVLLVWLVGAMGWYPRAGFTSTVRNVHLLWYPTVQAFIPVMVYGTVAVPVAGLLFYLGGVLATGISEETFARGLIVPALISRGKWLAVLVAGALFSVAHLSNLMFENFTVLKMAEVLLVTFSFAILYGALFLRTGNIFPLMVLHTIQDYSYVTSGAAGPYTAVPMAVSATVGMSLLNIAYGAYILRAVGRESAVASAGGPQGGARTMEA